MRAFLFNSTIQFFSKPSRYISAVGIWAALAATITAQTPETPPVVQPGAPGQPSRTLPAGTRAVLPQRSKNDVEFMQGMIMHHAQAVEMTALIETHTENKNLN